MMMNDDERGEGGKKCPKFDDVICERPLSTPDKLIKRDFTLPDRSGTGSQPGGGMLRSVIAR